MKRLYSGHPWDVANWLLYKGGLIIQCTFNREVLFGTLLGGCFREVTFLYRFAIWLLKTGFTVLKKSRSSLCLTEKEIGRKISLIACHCVCDDAQLNYWRPVPRPQAPPTLHPTEIKSAAWGRGYWKPVSVCV